MNLLNVVQSFIMFAGISSGLLVCVHGVHIGELTVGDVVLFSSMMAQVDEKRKELPQGCEGRCGWCASVACTLGS